MQSKRTAGEVYFAIFKCEDGITRKSWIDSGLMNFKRWESLLRYGVTLDNLKTNGTIIDADSYPKEVKEMTSQPEPKQVTPEEQEEAVQQYYQAKLVDVEVLPKEKQWF